MPEGTALRQRKPADEIVVEGVHRETADDTASEPKTKQETKRKEPPKDPSLPAPLVIQYLVILRIINAFTISTFFQPDEYFQSLEPAHAFAYGFGDTTWEWQNQLRSFNYPFLFYLSFRLSDVLGLGDIGVYLMPKLVQGVVSAISEYYLYKFAQKVFGHQREVLARTVLLLSAASSFNWFCFTRTFSNTFELNLTTIALSYWPWEYVLSGPNTSKVSRQTVRNFTKSLVFAALAVIVRPTNALIWIVLVANLLIRTPLLQDRIHIVFKAVFTGLAVFALNTAIDYYYYGELVFPIVNFLKFNVFSSFSQFYGTNAWHFHLSQSLPFILTTYLPFFVYGIIYFRDFALRGLFSTVIGVNIAAFSLIKHKEFRFIYQLMPFFLVFAAYGFSSMYQFAMSLPEDKDISKDKDTNTGQNESPVKTQSPWLKVLSKTAIYLVFIVNLALGVLLTQIQEKGVLDVINFLKFNPDVDSIGFLTPCHSTPLQSHLHRRDLADKIWYLSCDPPRPDALATTLAPEAAQEYLAQYKDELDEFYANPRLFLNIHMPPFRKQFRTRGKRYTYEWPTHLVFFEPLEPVMRLYLANSKYEECDRFFNSYFHWDSRRRGDVVVYCKWPWE